ncbi:MAG: hypothetical protein AAGE01_22710, partial [Pseudomonadota bacterium]
MPRTLFQPEVERDACGFGLIAQVDGTPSNELVVDALAALESMTHRGAVAADGLSGDGCGMLLSMPRGLYRAALMRDGVELPERYAVGMLFVHDTAEGTIGRLEAELAQSGWQP